MSDYPADAYAAVCAEARTLRAERDALAATLDRVRALAEEWRYKGEFGWDDGSHAYGPGPEGEVLDDCSTALRRALDGGAS